MASKIIFVKTRTPYASYKDLWKLVELAEFPICYPDEIDWQSDNFYILTPINGEVGPGITPRQPFPKRKCKIIWLNIEAPGEIEKDLIKMFDEVWMCDRDWAKKANTRFFFMASDERLNPSGTHDQPALSLAYLTNRRIPKYEEMGLDNDQCLDSTVRETKMANTKAMVVLHQGEVPIMSPQRFCLTAAAGAAMFYERVPDFYPFEEYKDFIPITYENCVEVFREWINKPELKQIAKNLHQKMCLNTNFKKEVGRMFDGMD